MKNDEATQNFLQHYGVLKQKWGVRNSIRAGGPGTAYELAMMRQRKAEKRKTEKLSHKIKKTQLKQKLHDEKVKLKASKAEAKAASKKKTAVDEVDDKPKDKSTTSDNANKSTTNIKTTNKLLRKEIKNLSDSDLRAYKDRLELERQVKNLSDDSIAPGRTFAKKLASTTAKTTITMAATTIAKYGSAKLISYLANKDKKSTRTSEEKAQDAKDFWNEVSKIMINNMKKK